MGISGNKRKEDLSTAVPEESLQHRARLSNPKFSLFSNPWYHASRSFCTGWMSSLPCQVILSPQPRCGTVSPRRGRVKDGADGNSLLGPGINLYRSKNAAQFQLTHPLHFASRG